MSDRELDDAGLATRMDYTLGLFVFDGQTMLDELQQRAVQADLRDPRTWDAVDTLLGPSGPA